MAKRTELGQFFDEKSLNKSAIARKTGISNNRLSELSNNANARIKADELYLIALASGVNAGELLERVCGYLKLKKSK